MDSLLSPILEIEVSCVSFYYSITMIGGAELEVWKVTEQSEEMLDKFKSPISAAWVGVR